MCHVLRKTPCEMNELIDRKLAGNQLSVRFFMFGATLAEYKCLKIFQTFCDLLK